MAASLMDRINKISLQAYAVIAKAGPVGHKHIPGDGDGDGIPYEGRNKGKVGAAQDAQYRTKPNEGDTSPHNAAFNYTSTLPDSVILSALSDKTTDWKAIAHDALAVEGYDENGKGVKGFPARKTNVYNTPNQHDEKNWSASRRIAEVMGLMSLQARSWIATGKTDFGAVLREQAKMRKLKGY